MPRWTTDDIPNQAGRIAVITGATGGLGYETALALARAGATVILTGRNDEKGADALRRIRAEAPGAAIDYHNLDLSSFASIAAFADSFARSHDRIDILVNNAGVMAPPDRRETADGRELQFGTNHLGHFALTARLLPLLRAGRARVVSLSSVAARTGRIDFDDLEGSKKYVAWKSYAQSKLACQMFAYELQRRSDAAGWGLTSIAAHPGVSTTQLIDNGMGPRSLAGRFKPLINLIFQPAADGALPILYAATAPGALPGGYYGPRGLMELRGPPGAAKPPRKALDQAVARRLWGVSEQMTGIAFPAREGR